MSSAQILDVRGTALLLGGELGRGGEGTVFDLPGHPELVAKIYHKLPAPAHAAKLGAMAAMAEERLFRVAAWPSATLHDRSRAVVGFTMPKVAGHRPVFQLYGPKLRLREFPRADWRFLIHAAANAARAFATVHAAGLVIGDVNHGNLVVAEDGTVRLIDCDSFQVSCNGTTWPCLVGVGTHQPPEMQNVANYAKIIRSVNHDNFGLAVIIFQILCMARHPFAGKYLGQGQPPTIEEAIARSRYAFSRERQRTAMAPPPGSLPMSALTPGIQQLFETAFAPGTVHGGRPTGDHWISALRELSAELKQCSINHGHHYLRQLTACPWCEIEAMSGTALFPVVFVPQAGVGSGMAALWQELKQVAEPQALPPLPSPGTIMARPSQLAMAAGRRERALQRVAYGTLGLALAAVLAFALPDSQLPLAGGLVVLACLLLLTGSSTPPNEFLRRLNDAKQELAALRAVWIMPASLASFAPLRAKLDALKAQHDTLPRERAARLQKLSEQRRQRQLEEHLDRFTIASAGIVGIGRAKIATLSAHGIDIASDVSEARIRAIPGFGRMTTARLLAWRRLREQSFVFDQRRGVAQVDLDKVEHDIAMERLKFEHEAAAGLAHLKAIAAAATTHRQSLEARAAALLPQLAQATADAKVAPGRRAVHGRMLALASTTLGIVLLMNLHNGSLLQRIQTISRPSSAAHSTVPSPQLASPVPASPPPPQTLPPEHKSDDGLPAPTAGPEHVITLIDINIRAEPNSRTSILRTATRGMTLRAFGRSGQWVKVGDENRPWGWAYSNLLGPAPAP